MGNSEAYQKFKRLYYQERLPIESTSWEYHAESGMNASVVFEDGDSEIEIEDTSMDFVEAVIAVKKTVENGEEKLIDLSDTPVENTGDYYDNVELFVSDSDSPISSSVERIYNNEADLPKDVDLGKALDASLDLNFEDENLRKVVGNYDNCIGMQLLQLKGFSDSFEEQKSSVPYTESRIMEYYETAEEILRLEFLTEPSLVGYQQYRENCISDTMFIAERLLDLRTNSQKMWESLHRTEGGQVDGSFGLYHLLQEYSSLFELMREPFCDLASIVNGENVENINDAINVLSDSDAQNLTEPIVPELRHGPAHFSIEFDDEAGKVNVYNRRARQRVLDLQVDYDEALEAYYKMRDSAIAVIYSFIFTEEMLKFMYLQSRDFMFRVIENAESGTFVPEQIRLI